MVISCVYEEDLESTAKVDLPALPVVILIYILLTEGLFGCGNST